MNRSPPSSYEERQKAEVDYSKENAEVLVTNSAEFDTWLNEVVFDLDNFRSQRERGESEAPGEDV